MAGKDKTTQHISERLAKARAKQGLTQAEVAKQIDKNTNYYAESNG